MRSGLSSTHSYDRSKNGITARSSFQSPSGRKIFKDRASDSFRSPVFDVPGRKIGPFLPPKNKIYGLEALKSASGMKMG